MLLHYLLPRIRKEKGEGERDRGMEEERKRGGPPSITDLGTARGHP